MPGLDDADSLEELILDLLRNDPEEKYLKLFSVFVAEVLQDAGKLHVLVEALHRNTTVTEVYVAYEVWRHLDDNEEEFAELFTEHWCMLLRAVGSLPALRRIALGEYWGTEGGFEATLAMLQCATQLTTLSFADQIDSEEDLRAFSNGLRALQALEKVTLSWFSPDSIRPILEALAVLPKIRDLRFVGHGASFIQRPPFSHMLRAPSLRSLMLRGYRLEEPDLQVIYRHAMHEQIKKLHFYYCTFPAGAGEHMAAELQTSTTLEDFSIVGKHETCLGRAFLLPIVQALRAHPAIQKLMLGDEFSDEDFCDDLAELIGKSASLTELTIDGDSLSDSAFRRILPSLKASSSLKTLSVMGNIFSKNSVRCGSIVTEIGKALANKNSTLQSLCLCVSHHNLAAFIGSLGRDNTTLSHIDLSEKALRFFHIESWPVVFDLNDEESDALVKAAKKNYGLEHIEADFKCQTLKRQLDIIFALNRAGRKYLQEDPPSKEKGVRVLSNVSDDLDCIFFHLLENPSLCKCEESSKCKGDIDSSSSHVGRKRKARVMDEDV